MTEYWIVPCNIKTFDIVEHFKTNNMVVWKNQFSIKKGDYAYIYIGNPVGAIKYKCVVTDDEVDEKTLNNNKYAIVENLSRNYFMKRIKYIQMKLVEEYSDQNLKLEPLKEHGLGQVQIQARASRELKRYLESIGC